MDNIALATPPVQDLGPETGLKEEIVLVFPSTTTVLNVEDLLEERGLAFELIPVPKAVNPNCGLAISFDDEARPAVMQALAQSGFRPSAAYLRRGEEYEPWGDRPFPSAAPRLEPEWGQAPSKSLIGGDCRPGTDADQRQPS